MGHATLGAAHGQGGQHGNPIESIKLIEDPAKNFASSERRKDLQEHAGEVTAEMTAALFRKVDCLSIPVPDLDAALAFYSSNLGHEIIWRSSTAAGLRLPATNAELVLHTQNRPLEADLAVDSVPEALARFTSAGGRLIRGPFEIQIGLCAVVSDPWNNVLVILDSSKGPLQVDSSKRVIEDRTSNSG